MSLYLCLSYPFRLADTVALAFGKIIYQTDCNSYPIGISSKGSNQTWLSTLLHAQDGPASLLGQLGRVMKGGILKPRKQLNHTDVFISCIRQILDSEEYARMSFLFHWMRGDERTEEVIVKREVILTIAELPEKMYLLEEDVRYIIIRAHTG